MLWSDFTPHEKDSPRDKDVKIPDGGVSWPYLLSPQQATVPSDFSAQV
jgi:hypothetical protein